MHEVTLFSKDEFRACICVLEEDFDLVAEEAEEVVACRPAQDHDPQQELQPDSPHHRPPLHLCEFNAMWRFSTALTSKRATDRSQTCPKFALRAKSDQMVSVSLIWQLGHVGKGPDVFAKPRHSARRIAVVHGQGRRQVTPTRNSNFGENGRFPYRRGTAEWFRHGFERKLRPSSTQHSIFPTGNEIQFCFDRQYAHADFHI